MKGEGLETERRKKSCVYSAAGDKKPLEKSGGRGGETSVSQTPKDEGKDSGVEQKHFSVVTDCLTFRPSAFCTNHSFVRIFWPLTTQH